MDKEQQVKVFAERLDKLIEGFVKEFNISYGELIGVLFMKAVALTLKK